MNWPRRVVAGALQVLIWALTNSLAGVVTGLAVGFVSGGIEAPIVIISVLFGNVVGFTVVISSVVLYPRLQGLAPLLRAALLGLTLLSGSILGSLAALNLYPLFVVSDPGRAAAIALINGVLALIVGSVVLVYESLRLRLQASLREVEEVRLVEARLREEAARAELAALQARINPHFFFNTLNTITSLLDEDRDKAEEVVQTLAALFRYTLKVSDTGPVPLREELDFTRNYLTVEQARFGERLHVEWEVDPDALEIGVPGLIVQPLGENAVGHGLAPRARGGLLRIAARLADGALRLDVTDDGVGLTQHGEDLYREGHGLGNVRSRLEAFYQGRAAMSVLPDPDGGGTQARLVLPERLP